MESPEATLDMNGCTVHLLGTIPGFKLDGERVAAAVKDHDPQAIALGVPASDLETLEALVADPTLADGLEPDQLDLHFMELITEFGPTAFIPSPDLHAAHASGLPLHGIDLSDEEHTQRFTETVKVRHLVQRTSARKELGKMRAEEVHDPYALARTWDATLCRVAPLGALEKEREEHMADALRTLTGSHERLLVVVHAARFDGVFTLLTNGP